MRVALLALCHHVALRPHLIAAGSGRGDGFGAVDAVALALTLERSPTPKVCFLPTASGDNEAHIDAFYAAYEGRAQTMHLSLFRRSRRDLEQTIDAADLLVVGGGNAANLLALWRLHGVDSLVQRAHARGCVIAGFSAGASVLFERSISDSFGPHLELLDDGLGLVAGCYCAHYRRPRRSERAREAAESVPPSERIEPFGYASSDGGALCFISGALAKTLPGGASYRLHADGVATELQAEAE